MTVAQPLENRKGLSEALTENASKLAAAAGVLGGVVYLLLYIACTWVYEPLGVSPSDVGLGYGELLVRAGVGFVGVLAFGIAWAFVTNVGGLVLGGVTRIRWGGRLAVVLL